MKHDDRNFAERRDSAAAAKRKMLEKIANAPRPSDAELAAKKAERAAAATLRDAKRAEREALERQTAEKRAEQNSNAELQATEKAADEADRKAERDRRYAARKARQT